MPVRESGDNFIFYLIFYPLYSYTVKSMSWLEVVEAFLNFGRFPCYFECNYWRKSGRASEVIIYGPFCLWESPQGSHCFFFLLLFFFFLPFFLLISCAPPAFYTQTTQAPAISPKRTLANLGQMRISPYLLFRTVLVSQRWTRFELQLREVLLENFVIFFFPRCVFESSKYTPNFNWK